MKTKFTVDLRDAQKLRSFVDSVGKLQADINAYQKRFIVDACSFLGMMSISDEPIMVEILNGDEITKKKFEEICAEYAINDGGMKV